MKILTNVSGARYVNHLFTFENGSNMIVEDEDAQYLLDNWPDHYVVMEQEFADAIIEEGACTLYTCWFNEVTDPASDEVTDPASDEVTDPASDPASDEVTEPKKSGRPRKEVD